MRFLFVVTTALLLCPSFVFAQGYHPVGGYLRSNGTYVQPHYQTNPDYSVQNNWTTYPNVNPFTGETGTRHYDTGISPVQPSYDYGSSHNNFGSTYSGYGHRSNFLNDD